MKVFVDTSVWINYLKGHKTEKAEYLSQLVGSGQSLFSLPVIVQEILQGLKHEKDVPSYAEKFEALNFLDFQFQEAVEAARLFRILRKHGITVTTIDLQIATVCLKHGLHLLTDDEDFQVMSKQLGLPLI